MAVTRKSQSTALIYKVVTAVGQDGAKTYRTATISKVNPAITDENFYTTGTLLTELQDYEVTTLSRRDTAELESA